MSDPTTDVAIWAALKARIEAMPGLPFVAWPGQAFDPPMTGGLPAQYLIVEDFRLETLRLFMAHGEPSRLRGLLNVAVMTPVRFAYEIGLQMAGTVAEWLPEGLRMTLDGVTVEVADKPGLRGSGYRDGGCHRVPMVIRWQAFAA